MIRLDAEAVEKFGALLADPPWHFRVWSEKGAGRSATRHYPIMETDDICKLNVPSLCAKDCVLFLWATPPCIEAAFRVISAWGFTYKTVGFTWVKTTTNGLLHWGMGYWSRANTELCLLATRGHPVRQARNVHSVIISPVREHSRKPDEQYERIERLVDGPYMELFARFAHPGWTSWGNEVCSELDRPKQVVVSKDGIEDIGEGVE